MYCKTIFQVFNNIIYCTVQYDIKNILYFLLENVRNNIWKFRHNMKTFHAKFRINSSLLGVGGGGQELHREELHVRIFATAWTYICCNSPSLYKVPYFHSKWKFFKKHYFHLVIEWKNKYINIEFKETYNF